MTNATFLWFKQSHIQLKYKSMKVLFITLTVCIISILFPSIVLAQTTDMVYLNNGSIIKGRLVEQNSDNFEVETCCGSLYVFDKSEVLKIEVVDMPMPGYIKNKGYFNYTSMGLLAGSENDDKRSIFSFLMEHHYQINQYISFGGVMGVEFYNESVSPLGGVVKLVLPGHGMSAFFVGLSGGHLMPLEDAENVDYYEIIDTKGGPFVNAELGLIIPSKSNTNMFIGLGYRYNELNYVREDWYYGDIERKVSYNRLSLKLGVMLH